MKGVVGIVSGFAVSLAATTCSAGPGRVDATTSQSPNVVVSLGDSSMPSPSLGLPGHEYASEDDGFTFHYPDGWHVRTTGGGVVVYPARTLKTSPANVSVSAIQLPAPMTLKKYFSQDVTLLQSIPGFKLLGVTDETFADESAFAISYMIATKGHTSRSLQYTTVMGDTVYSAIYTSVPSRYRRYFVDAGLVVRSFRLV